MGATRTFHEANRGMSGLEHAKHAKRIEHRRDARNGTARRRDRRRHLLGAAEQHGLFDTSGWQALPSKPSAPLSVVNTRHDDVAYIRWVGGTTPCLPPRSTFNVSGGQLDAVRISSSATC
ncbi:hypothetical protein ACU639_29725 [Streptomyces cynarae]|uniref:hypothetical protein n=1 Tax=Streptomyces cynarae TaxID=2981134 RepID=UPI00406CEC09